MKTQTTTLALAIGAVLAAGASAVPAAAHARAIDIVTTARDTGQRLASTGKLALTKVGATPDLSAAVQVQSTRRYQEFLGIGGAITDAAAEVFAKLRPEQQQAMLDAYYDRDKGIGYSLLRTTIHSSDFSSASYTYVQDGDAALKTFSIGHDRAYRLPLIKRALTAAGGDIKVFASPWSAPGFMKTNNHMLNGGSLLPRYAPAWASYMTRFIQEYEKEGVPVWGLTIQNEPLAVQRWESMIFTAEEERDFLKHHLGPALHKAGLARVKVIGWDHNRDFLPQRAQVMLDDPEAARYLWGMGFHWYENWAGGEQLFRNVAAVRAAYPETHLLLTEATVEKFTYERLQHWPNAERYGVAMINDFNAGAEGWTDWNILLDEKGGPNHVANFCFAPLHGDTRTGELIFTPSYYYIGHFSKFIRPGAHRVGAVTTTSDLLATAFRNRDGSVVTVLMNGTDKPIRYRFQLDGMETPVEIPAHAMQTVLHRN